MRRKCGLKNTILAYIVHVWNVWLAFEHRFHALPCQGGELRTSHDTPCIGACLVLEVIFIVVFLKKLFYKKLF